MTESRISVYANSSLEGSGMEKMNMLLMLPIANVHWNDFSWDSGKGTIHGLRLRDSRDSRDSGVMVMEVDKVADEVTGMEVL